MNVEGNPWRILIDVEVSIPSNSSEEVKRDLGKMGSFMPRRPTTEAIHLFRKIMEKKRSLYDPICDTKSFLVVVKLHQGLTLSILWMRCIVRSRVKCLRECFFADDSILVAKSRNDLNVGLDSWRVTLEEKGLRISNAKTEYL
uniref:Reverse transcriptase domain-containing protein n=1 Tax=Lactuca sativa TaxID=4236 RepID=A0A9R1X5K6_LACSA|nr:hypothetical protein LSAT_V11C600335720 [Lactuca sativa]